MYIEYLFIVAAAAARFALATVLAIRYWMPTLLNAELAKQWKPILAKKPALPGADEWARVKDKLDRLVR
jgi:hypothetical protein